MKIFSPEQIYQADSLTTERQGITSDALMERTAEQLFNWMHLRLQGAPVKIHLFCGIGNNGGDGIALARHLQEHGYHVETYVVNYSEKRSEDFLKNLARLKERKVWPTYLNEESDFPELSKEDIIVDAIFGIGLNRNLASWVVGLIKHINKSNAFVLAVDIPSGLFSDRVPDENAAIRANVVLSLQSPKLVFFLPETGIYCNQWEVIDIGLDAVYLASTETAFELISKNEVLPLYQPREKFSHKGTYGHAGIIGGSMGKIGAVHLAAKAALLAGSGLVTAVVPSCGILPLQVGLTEVMVKPSANEKSLTDIPEVQKATVFGVGVGMGTSNEVQKAFFDFIASNQSPMVIDADGINCLALQPEKLKIMPAQTVLTPHPKELERLIGGWKDDFDKLKKAIAFSLVYDCILVIKGANTITVYKNKSYVNTTGNPGMATAGSGDVLTGVITGLLAQGYSPLSAALFGVYIHGKAGDIAVEKTGYQSLTATEICGAIGASFLDLFSVPEQPAAEQK